MTSLACQSPQPVDVLDPYARFRRELSQGNPAERLAAFRSLSLSLRSSLTLATVQWRLGDPWHRTPARTDPSGETTIELLAWRHPEILGTQLQVLIENGRFSRAQVVVDGGASLPPRILGVAEYWEEIARGGVWS